MGAAFTEGENWDGLKTSDKTLPPDFKTEGMPAVNKDADSFESRMQKEAKDNLDKSANEVTNAGSELSRCQQLFAG